jgi:hypothetical protein
MQYAKSLTLGLCLTLAATSPVLAFQDIGRPSPEAVKETYPGKD